ncbi:MAG: urease accessory protein UreD [Gammaproteobacteria bacterium]
MYCSSIEAQAPGSAGAVSDVASVQAEPAAQLRLVFSADPNRRTYLHRQRASYPFHVCRALYLDPDLPGMATIYAQSSSGGIYEGERLSVDVRACPQARAHITTQASTIVHEMSTGEAHHEINLIAESDSLIEYLPDPLILFPDARLHSMTTVEITRGATVILGDAFLSHDPEDRGRSFDLLENELAIRDSSGRLLVRDRFRVTGQQLKKGQPGITGEHSHVATVVAATERLPADVLSSAMRDALNACPDVYAGISALPDDAGVWARLLATHGAPLKSAVTDLWSALRYQLTGAAPGRRRK